MPSEESEDAGRDRLLALREISLRWADLFSSRGQDLHALHPHGTTRLACSGRGALFQLFEALPESGRKTVLLPAYHCTVLAEPIVRAGYDVRYYAVTPELGVDHADLRAQIDADVVAVVVIHYFGFPTDLREVQGILAGTGVLLIEDCAHSFLTTYEDGRRLGTDGDVAVYSFAKLVPCVVGGALSWSGTLAASWPPQPALPMRTRMRIRRRLLGQVARNSPRNPVSAAVMAAERVRARLSPGKESAASGRAAAERTLLDGRFVFDEQFAGGRLPAFVESLIESMDWPWIGRRRRENYARLGRLLAERTALRQVFLELPVGVVPLALPVMLPRHPACRALLDDSRASHLSFGEPFHTSFASASTKVREAAEDLARRLVLLPIHQQMEDADIDELVRRLAAFEERVRGAPG